jgi:hypothetical protein
VECVDHRRRRGHRGPRAQGPAGGPPPVGTGQLDLTLIDEGLVDELHLWVFPVIAGGGQRLLDGIDTTHLALLDTTPLTSGIVVHVYGPK